MLPAHAARAGGAALGVRRDGRARAARRGARVAPCRGAARRVLRADGRLGGDGRRRARRGGAAARVPAVALVLRARGRAGRPRAAAGPRAARTPPHDRRPVCAAARRAGGPGGDRRGAGAAAGEPQLARNGAGPGCAAQPKGRPAGGPHAGARRPLPASGAGPAAGLPARPQPDPVGRRGPRGGRGRGQRHPDRQQAGQLPARQPALLRRGRVLPHHRPAGPARPALSRRAARRGADAHGGVAARARVRPAGVRGRRGLPPPRTALPRLSARQHPRAAATSGPGGRHVRQEAHAEGLPAPAGGRLPPPRIPAQTRAPVLRPRRSRAPAAARIRAVEGRQGAGTGAAQAGQVQHHTRRGHRAVQQLRHRELEPVAAEPRGWGAAVQRLRPLPQAPRHHAARLHEDRRHQEAQARRRSLLPLLVQLPPPRTQQPRQAHPTPGTPREPLPAEPPPAPAAPALCRPVPAPDRDAPPRPSPPGHLLLLLGPHAVPPRHAALGRRPRAAHLGLPAAFVPRIPVAAVRTLPPLVVLLRERRVPGGHRHPPRLVRQTRTHPRRRRGPRTPRGRRRHRAHARRPPLPLRDPGLPRAADGPRRAVPPPGEADRGRAEGGGGARRGGGGGGGVGGVTDPQM